MDRRYYVARSTRKSLAALQYVLRHRSNTSLCTALSSALERVLERKGFIARHSGLRLCWPSLAIIGLLGLPFSVVFFAQFGLAFLLVFHGLGFQAFFLRLS